MLVGKGVDPADAGEIWHMFDQKAMPLTKLDVDQLPNVNLNRYSTLILVNGNYSGLSKETTKK
jgi:hypothetical protein